MSYPLAYYSFILAQKNLTIRVERIRIFDDTGKD